MPVLTAPDPVGPNSNVGQSSGLPAFQDLVYAELRLARGLYPPRTRHLEAAAYIREMYDDYWSGVKTHVERRAPGVLLHALIRVAAMAQRAAEDLILDRPPSATELSAGWSNSFTQPMPAPLFARLATEEEPRLRSCLGPPLLASHAAAMWLRFAVRRYEDAIEMGVTRRSAKLALDQLVDIAARCRVIAADLNYLARATAGPGLPGGTGIPGTAYGPAAGHGTAVGRARVAGLPVNPQSPALGPEPAPRAPSPETPTEAECPACHSYDARRHHDGGLRCRTCGNHFLPEPEPRPSGRAADVDTEST